jgi:hypothetical protein
LAASFVGTLLAPTAHALRLTPTVDDVCGANLVVIAKVMSFTVDPSPSAEIPTLVHATVEALIHGLPRTEVVLGFAGRPRSSEDPPAAPGTRLLLFLWAPSPWPETIVANPYNGPSMVEWEQLDPTAVLPMEALLQDQWSIRCNPPAADPTPYRGGWFPTLRTAP